MAVYLKVVATARIKIQDPNPTAEEIKEMEEEISTNMNLMEFLPNHELLDVDCKIETEDAD